MSESDEDRHGKSSEDRHDESSEGCHDKTLKYVVFCKNNIKLDEEIDRRLCNGKIIKVDDNGEKKELHFHLIYACRESEWFNRRYLGWTKHQIL